MVSDWKVDVMGGNQLWMKALQINSPFTAGVIHQMRNILFRSHANTQSVQNIPLRNLKRSYRREVKSNVFHWHRYHAATWPKLNLNKKIGDLVKAQLHREAAYPATPNTFSRTSATLFRMLKSQRKRWPSGLFRFPVCLVTKPMTYSGFSDVMVKLAYSYSFIFISFKLKMHLWTQWNSLRRSPEEHL